MWKRWVQKSQQTNQVTMRRAKRGSREKKIKAVTKTGYGKGFEYEYICKDVPLVVSVRGERARSSTYTPETVGRACNV